MRRAAASLAVTAVTAGLLAIGLPGSAAAAGRSVTEDVGAAAGACTGVTAIDSPNAPHYLIQPVNVASGSRDCTLSRGASGPAVRALQRALSFCYGHRLVSDGVLGPQTVSALRAVQASEGIPADGVYAPLTRTALLWPEYEDPNGATATGRCERER